MIVFRKYSSKLLEIIRFYSKNVIFKTRQYCSCPQVCVNIYLFQVDWRGLAPQIIQYPETPLRGENRP